MKIKLLKPIYLNSNYVLEGSELEAKLEDGYLFVEYKTCCSDGVRRLEPGEYELVENEE